MNLDKNFNHSIIEVAERASGLMYYFVYVAQFITRILHRFMYLPRIIC